jgi:membrane protein required for colicin V production
VTVTLTGWDWFIALVLLLSVGIGIWRGLVRTVFALGAWVFAFLGTPVVASLLGVQMSSSTPNWVMFAVVFIALFAVIRFTGFVLARGLAKAGLGGLDRGLGAALGIVRALVFVALAAVAGLALGMHKQAAWQSAFSRPVLDGIIQKLAPFLPERITGIRKT